MITRPASAYQRAINRAKAAGGSKLVAEDRMDNTYVVRSSTHPNTFYRVDARDPHDWTCDCRAGQVSYLMCLHRSAVFLYRLGLDAASHSIIEKELAHAR